MAARWHGLAVAAAVAFVVLSGCSQPGAPKDGTGSGRVDDDGLATGTSTGTDDAEGPSSNAAASNGTSASSSSSGPSTSANPSSSTATSNGTASGTGSSTSTGTDSSTSSTPSGSSSSSSSASSSTSSAPQYQFRVTLVNHGLTAPDAFYCYVDGSDRCDAGPDPPAPGASADYWFTTSGAPDLLQVSALYAQTWPVAQYTFTSVDPYAEILVQTSEATISASCSSGCSLA